MWPILSAITLGPQKYGHLKLLVDRGSMGWIPPKIWEFRKFWPLPSLNAEWQVQNWNDPKGVPFREFSMNPVQHLMEDIVICDCCWPVPKEWVRWQQRSADRKMSTWNTSQIRDRLIKCWMFVLHECWNVWLHAVERKTNGHHLLLVGRWGFPWIDMWISLYSPTTYHQPTITIHHFWVLCTIWLVSIPKLDSSYPKM